MSGTAEAGTDADTDADTAPAEKSNGQESSGL
jgi:hypothetical protein